MLSAFSPMTVLHWQFRCTVLSISVIVTVFIVVIIYAGRKKKVEVA